MIDDQKLKVVSSCIGIISQNVGRGLKYDSEEVEKRDWCIVQISMIIDY